MSDLAGVAMAGVTMSGVERIAEAFARARADGRRAALMPYMMGGYPDLERSRAIAAAYVRGGADLVELGVPFSDPLADGPVIHAAATAALSAGVTLDQALAVGAEIARQVPVIVMCYANPIFTRGIERFLDSLVTVGVCGVIVPDLPFDEATEMRARCTERGLALVPLVAPTTPPERIEQISAAAQGFLYVVSLTGTTGERASLDGELSAVIGRAAVRARVPVAVGFGISGPAQAATAVAAGAEGVIVGSRLVRLAGEAADAAADTEQAVRELAGALR